MWWVWTRQLNRRDVYLDHWYSVMQNAIIYLCQPGMRTLIKPIWPIVDMIPSNRSIIGLFVYCISKFKKMFLTGATVSKGQWIKGPPLYKLIDLNWTKRKLGNREWKRMTMVVDFRYTDSRCIQVYETYHLYYKYTYASSFICADLNVCNIIYFTYDCVLH